MIDEFKRAGPMMDLMLRYTQALITQISQTAVCNRHHSVEQQLCRWLLLTLDRLPSNELTMTQELIAGMLGVRREGITEAAGNLQQAGLISYRRGHITVINRSGLESLSCECYGVVKKEFAACSRMRIRQQPAGPPSNRIVEQAQAMKLLSFIAGGMNIGLGTTIVLYWRRTRVADVSRQCRDVDQ